MVWKHLGLPDPTPIQYDIAQWLQYGALRQVDEAFRGVGKSWITSAFACWVLLMNPQEKILVVSASKGRADDFSTFTKRLIREMPVLQHLIARNDQRDSNISFDVAPATAAHAPSVKSVGITGQLAGSRATLIIADDVEVPNNSNTQTQRDKLSELVKEFDAVLSPGGRIVYLGTPQTEESIYSKLEERGYSIRIWPARYPKTTKARDIYGTRLAPFLADKFDADPESHFWTPTDPLRFSDQDLLEREASYGRSGFALQFMLDTSLSDANRYPLKLADLIVMAVDRDTAPDKVVWASSPELARSDLPCVGFTGDRYYRPMHIHDNWSPYQGSVMVIDPAGRGRDELAYAVVKCLHGMLFLSAVGGLRGGYVEENLVKLALIARDNKVNYITIENNFGDGMFQKLLEPIMALHYPCSIDPDGIKQSVQKEKRIIDTLEPVLNSHRLIVDERIIKADAEVENKQYQLFYQLTRITKERGALVHDDRIDVLAMAVNYWIEMMSADLDVMVENRKEELLDAELKRFMEHVVGHEVLPDLWVNTQ